MSDDLQQCQANCEARIYPVALTGRPGNEVLLKITNFYFCRYLIFGPTRVRAGKPTAWRFLGYIDHAFNKYETSWHRVIAQGNKHWLVIRGQTRSGTGFSSYDDTWYEVSKNNWQPSRQRAGGLWVVSSNSTATRGFALEVAGTISSFRGLTWRRPDEDCEIRWCCLLSLLL